MNWPTLEELKARKKPIRCPNAEPPYTDDKWDNYGCRNCGARYHCSKCGGGTGMMAHWVEWPGFKGFTCEVAEG